MLRAAGAQRGERVVVLLPDTPEAAAIVFGAMHVGAIPARSTRASRDEELAHVCEDAQPAVAVTTSDRVATLLAIRARTGWPQTVVAFGGQAPTGEPVLDAAEAIAAAEPAEAAPCGPDDPALLQYTSGSTGRPKAVVHLHRGLLALPEGFGRRLALTEDDLCYSAAKLSFGYGFGNSLLFPLAAGASALLRAEPTEPVGVLETIAARRPTVFFGGPSLYTALLAVQDPRDPHDTSSLRLCVSAARRSKPGSSVAGSGRSGCRSSTGSARPSACTSSSRVTRPTSCARLARDRRRPRTSCACSTTTARRSTPAAPVTCTCAGRRTARATGSAPRRRRRRWATAGSAPGTCCSAHQTARSSTSAAATTSSRCAG